MPRPRGNRCGPLGLGVVPQVRLFAWRGARRIDCRNFEVPHSSYTYMVPVPGFVNQLLQAAATAREVEGVIAREEGAIGAVAGGIRNDGPPFVPSHYLICDQAADLMSEVLQCKGIPHVVAIGESDTGDSHSYIVSESVYYDPTKQGFGNRRYTVGYRYRRR